MADNTTLNTGTGGDVIATDDIAGVKHQRVKVQYGVDGAATDVSDTNPLPIDDAGGSLTVDGTVTADAGTGPWPVTDNGGSLTVDNAALSVTGGGVEASALRVTLANDSTGVVSVDDNGGALTVDGTVTADAGTGTFTTGGDTAHDAADSGNPVKIGAKAESDIDSITLAADGDRTDLYAGRDGVLVTRPDSPLENLVTGTANATGTANTSTIGAQGASVKTYLTDILVTNASATDTEVIIKDGTTEKIRLTAPANGGGHVSLHSPIAGTANTAWQFASVDAVTTMYVTMSGFTSQI
jgi:hypothetical protein